MGYLESAIIIGCASALMLNVPLYQTLIKRLDLDRKPFNCGLCLSFWNSIVICSVYFEIEFLEILMVSATAAVIGELIDRKLNDF